MEQVTTDIWFTAFLLNKKYQIDSYSKENRKAYFKFAISDEDWNKCKIEFSKSPYSQVKYDIEKVKDLIF